MTTLLHELERSGGRYGKKKITKIKKAHPKRTKGIFEHNVLGQTYGFCTGI